MGALDAFDSVSEGIAQLLIDSVLTCRAPVELRRRSSWLHSLLWTYALSNGARLNCVSSCDASGTTKRAIIGLLISNLILEPVLEATTARIEKAARSASSVVHGVAHSVGEVASTARLIATGQATRSAYSIIDGSPLVGEVAIHFGEGGVQVLLCLVLDAKGTLDRWLKDTVSLASELAHPCLEGI